MNTKKISDKQRQRLVYALSIFTGVVIFFSFLFTEGFLLVNFFKALGLGIFSSLGVLLISIGESTNRNKNTL